MRKLCFFIACLAGFTAAPGVVRGRQQSMLAGQQQPGQLPTRDQPSPPPQPTAAIAGRVVTADTGHPIKRARVVIAGSGRGGQSTITDEQGTFGVTGLAAGSYTISASKAGFVDAIYGQRHPLQAGTPVNLADGQQLNNIDLRLIRGGVITGRIADEDGEPLVRAHVTVERYQYVRGERQLTMAGNITSDDRGEYRVFGLPPGDYFVSAISSDADMSPRGMQTFGAPGGGRATTNAGTAGGGRGARGARGGFGLGINEDPEPTGYAATYFPGVMSVPEAQKVTVGPGQEVSGIDFQVQLVPFVTVSGIVGGAENSPASVMLVPQDGAGGTIIGAPLLRGVMQRGGAFTITNVPPGRYLAIARSGGFFDDPKTAIQPLTVAGQNVSNLALVPVSGVSLSGNITVESSGTPAPNDYSTFRISVPESNPLPSNAGGPIGGRGGGAGGTVRAQANGSFEVDNLLPGQHYVQITGNGPWTLKSVIVAGRDVTDQSFEVKSGQNVGDAAIVLTDRSTSINGTVRD
ncbi:MAG TPA: carboxypeptidase-like regulatory domain-containing protein, partial [Vicinamibacterales bacterium]